MTLLLGHDTTCNRVALGNIESRSGLYVLGVPGVGKSTLLLNNIIQYISDRTNFFFLDPHGEAIEKIITHNPLLRYVSDHIILLDPSDETHSFGINPLACTDVSSRNARRDSYNKTIDVFKRIWSKEKEWGVWLERILQHSLPLLIETQYYTLAELPLFLNDKNFRDYICKKIRYNKPLLPFWEDEFKSEQAQSTLNRVGSLLADDYVRDVIGQQQTTIDFHKFVNDFAWFVLMRIPPNIADTSKNFLGTLVLTELLHTIRMRTEEDRKLTYALLIDEFQHFASDHLATFILETRKHGCAITLSHQERVGQFGENDKILGATAACANKVFFQLTPKDAREFAPEFAKSPEPADTRWVQELVISKEPFWDLLTKGHVNRRIQELAFRYFHPLREQLQRLKDQLESGKLERMELQDQATLAQDEATFFGFGKSQLLRRGVSSTPNPAATAAFERKMELHVSVRGLTGQLLELFQRYQETRNAIFIIDRFLILLMEGQLTITQSEELAQFLSLVLDRWFSRVQYRKILYLYLGLRYGIPETPRPIPGILAGKYWPEKLWCALSDKVRKDLFDYYGKINEENMPRRQRLIAAIEEAEREGRERAKGRWEIDLRQDWRYSFYTDEVIDSYVRNRMKTYWRGEFLLDEEYARVPILTYMPTIEELKSQHRHNESPRPVMVSTTDIPPSVLSELERQKLLDICVKELRGLTGIDGITGGVFPAIDEVIELCGQLQKEENHIKVPSGQYVQKPVSIRTVADMTNEAAQTLSNLPRFNAYAKLMQGNSVWKGKITTLEHPPRTLSAEEAKQCMAELTDFTRQVCCTPRDQVAEALEHRRTVWKLKTPDSLPPAQPQSPPPKRPPNLPPQWGV